MTWAWNPWAIPSLVAAPLFLALAWVVFRAQPRRPQNVVLSAALFMSGLTGQVAGGLRFLAADSATGYALWVVNIIVGLGTILPLLLVFYSTLPTPWGRPFRPTAARITLAAASLAVTALLLLNPGWIMGGVERVTPPGLFVAQGPGPLFDAWLWYLTLVPLYGVVVSLSAVRHSRTVLERRQMKAIAAAFVTFNGFAAILALVLGGLWRAGIVSVSATAFAQFQVGPFVSLAFGALLAYGILRAQILDIDLRIKWTIRQSTIAAAFVAVVIGVSAAVQEWLGQSQGLVWGGLAAGLLVFAINPLQRAAERVANAAMPNVKAPSEMTQLERVALYREQLALAYQDGAVDKSERILLENLRLRLGLTAEQAQATEMDLARA